MCMCSMYICVYICKVLEKAEAFGRGREGPSTGLDSPVTKWVTVCIVFVDLRLDRWSANNNFDSNGFVVFCGRIKKKVYTYYM